jgi:hypothetical protein
MCHKRRRHVNFAFDLAHGDKLFLSVITTHIWIYVVIDEEFTFGINVAEHFSFYRTVP